MGAPAGAGPVRLVRWNAGYRDYDEDAEPSANGDTDNDLTQHGPQEQCSHNATDHSPHLAGHDGASVREPILKRYAVHVGSLLAGTRTYLSFRSVALVGGRHAVCVFVALSGDGGRGNCNVESRIRQTHN